MFCAPTRTRVPVSTPATVAIEGNAGTTNGLTAPETAWGERPSSAAKARASAIVLCIFQLVPTHETFAVICRRPPWREARPALRTVDRSN